jgi:phosphatidylglycerol:prolipoprotein diacylglycerol transferase
MHGQLFTLFELPFPSYFTLLVTGFLFATAAGAAWARRVGQNPDVIVDLGLAMLIAGIIGGRLLHVVADGYFLDYVNLCVDPARVSWRITEAQCASAAYGGVWDAAAGVCHPAAAGTLLDTLDRCTAWAQVWRSGYAFYGGFIVAAGAAWVLLARDRFPFWRAADMAGMVVPVGLAFGRMGCLLAGCCFGQPFGGAWGVSFPPGSPASESQWKLGVLDDPNLASLAVHPTQIYESAGSLLIAAFLALYWHGRKRYDGQVFVGFMLLYGALRFAIEALRADDRGALFGLSTSQLIGVGVMIAALMLHRRLSRRAAERLALEAP